MYKPINLTLALGLSILFMFIIAITNSNAYLWWRIGFFVIITSFILTRILLQNSIQLSVSSFIFSSLTIVIFLTAGSIIYLNRNKKKNNELNKTAISIGLGVGTLLLLLAVFTFYSDYSGLFKQN